MESLGSTNCDKSSGQPRSVTPRPFVWSRVIRASFMGCPALPHSPIGDRRSGMRARHGRRRGSPESTPAAQNPTQNTLSKLASRVGQADLPRSCQDHGLGWQPGSRHRSRRIAPTGWLKRHPPETPPGPLRYTSHLSCSCTSCPLHTEQGGHTLEDGRGERYRTRTRHAVRFVVTRGRAVRAHRASTRTGATGLHRPLHARGSTRQLRPAGVVACVGARSLAPARAMGRHSARARCPLNRVGGGVGAVAVGFRVAVSGVVARAPGCALTGGVARLAVVASQSCARHPLQPSRGTRWLGGAGVRVGGAARCRNATWAWRRRLVVKARVGTLKVCLRVLWHARSNDRTR